MEPPSPGPVGPESSRSPLGNSWTLPLVLAVALAATGWHNYSLFLRADGLLIGYVETPSLEAAVAGMAETEVNARWQAEMAPFFEWPSRSSAALPDQGFLVLEEVFHLP